MILFWYKRFGCLQCKAIHHTSSHRARMAQLYHRDGSHLGLLPVTGSNLDDHHLAHVCRYLYVEELHNFPYRFYIVAVRNVPLPTKCSVLSQAGTRRDSP